MINAGDGFGMALAYLEACNPPGCRAAFHQDVSLFLARSVHDATKGRGTLPDEFQAQIVGIVQGKVLVFQVDGGGKEFPVGFLVLLQYHRRVSPEFVGTLLSLRQELGQPGRSFGILCSDLLLNDEIAKLFFPTAAVTGR
jgi:hypothetical protein